MENNKNKFVHLKVRSHFSILEGSMKIADIVKAAKKTKIYNRNFAFVIFISYTHYTKIQIVPLCEHHSSLSFFLSFASCVTVK